MSVPVELVLIPGLLCDFGLWTDTLTHLHHDGPIRIADTTSDTTIADMATRVIASRVDDTPFAVAGLSMGGYVGMEIARRSPVNLVGVAVLDSTPHPDTPTASADRRDLIRMSRQHGIQTAVDRLLPTFLSPRARRTPSIVAQVRTMAHRVGTHAFARQQHAIITRPDSTRGFPALPPRVSTIVLCGAEDTLTPPSVSHDLAQLLAPHGEHYVLPDCGHLSTLEQPRAVADALTHWLSHVASPITRSPR